jgi:hypothetical protein
VACGFVGFADHIAAINIGRVAVNQPDVSESFLKPSGSFQDKPTNLFVGS